MKRILGTGAEATVTLTKDGTVQKTRSKKAYRHPTIDENLTTSRTRAEERILKKARAAGIRVPTVLAIDKSMRVLTMEHIDGKKLRDYLTTKNASAIAKELGKTIADMHNSNIIHADLTTSNIIVRDNHLTIIDFGLSYISQRTEDKAVDLHLLWCAIDSYHGSLLTKFWRAFIKAYTTHILDDAVISRLNIVRARGRNKQ